jgi:hypothetical protein
MINILLALITLLAILIFAQAIRVSCLLFKSAVVANPVKSAYKQFQLFFLIVLQSYCTLILLLLILIAQPEVNVAGIVGNPLRSQYLPEVATAHSNGVFIKLQ